MTKDETLKNLSIIWERIYRLQNSKDDVDSYYWNDGQYLEALENAIEYIEVKMPKYRKKYKRFKRKYLELVTQNAVKDMGY